MQQIIDYVAVLFKNLPQTPRVKQAKEEILDSMLSKYEEYTAQQMADSEAIGRVIGEFGNLEELLEVLELDLDTTYIDSDQLKEFLKYIKSFSLSISFGVSVIILSIAISLLISQYALIPLFIGVVIGLACFITSGFKLKQYQDILNSTYTLTEEDKTMMTSMKRKYMSHFIPMLIISLAILLFTIPLWSILEIGNLVYPLIIAVIALGLFLLIYTSIPFGFYDQILSRKHQQKENTLYSAIIMPIIIFIYILIGFLFDGWHPWWILIPIGGVISGYLDNLQSNKPR